MQPWTVNLGPTMIGHCASDEQPVAVGKGGVLIVANSCMVVECEVRKMSDILE